MFDILKTVQVPVRSLTSESVAAGRPEEVQETLSQARNHGTRCGRHERDKRHPCRTGTVLLLEGGARCCCAAPD